MASRDLSRKINGLPEPALLIDHAGTVIAANVAASRLFRLSSTKIIGRPLSRLVSDDPKKLTRYLRRCSRNSEEASSKLTILLVGWQAIVCRAVGRLLQPHRDQPHVLCLKLLTRAEAPAKSDAHLRVADEKRAQQQADQRWRTTFDSAAIGIVMADFNGRYFAANSTFRKMLGLYRGRALPTDLQGSYI